MCRGDMGADEVGGAGGGATLERAGGIELVES